MAESPTTSLSVGGEVRDAAASVRAALSATLTAIGWVLLAAASVGWIVFWSALARVHLARGQAGGAALSAVPILVLVGFVVVRFGLRR